MQILITGGTGYLGSVLVEHFVAAGHEVVALTRFPESAAKTTEAGAFPLLGNLTDTALLEKAAAETDAVVHTAVDYFGGEDAIRAEAAAVEALTRGAGAAGTGKPFLYTSTNLVYGLDPTHSRDEDAELPEPGLQPFKLVGERLVREAAGLNSIIIRAGLVYGRGGSLLLTSLIGAATQSGAATYIDAGDNEWTPVHVDDLARLYLTALERPVAGTYNAAGPQQFTFRELAEAIAGLDRNHRDLDYRRTGRERHGADVRVAPILGAHHLPQGAQPRSAGAPARSRPLPGRRHGFCGSFPVVNP